MTDLPELKLGGKVAQSPTQRIRRMALLLWGSSGCGKTTLAATAPSNKLWVSFDPDATAALGPRDDIIEVDFSSSPDRVVEKFRQENEDFFRDLDRTLAADEERKIETVVFDSVTSFRDKGLVHGVTVAKGTKKGAKSTLEDPGYSGYGNLNTWTRQLVKNGLEVTLRHNRHVIFIAHEDKPTTDDEGRLLFISIMLGSSLNEQVPVKLTEVWHMEDTGKLRRIQVRPARAFKPMKSRMFITSSKSEFVWDYDDETKEGEGIETWYERWRANNYAKIPLPT